MAVDDSYTRVLLHCDGADASTTVTDESGKTWTAVNNAQLDTAVKKFGTASLLFDGITDSATTPDHSDFNFGTGDFTIDFRTYINSATDFDTFVAQHDDANNRWDLAMNNSPNNRARFTVVDGGTTLAEYTTESGGNLSTGAWHHFAFVRSGTSFYIFIDGVSQTLTVPTPISTNSMPDLSAVLTVGNNPTYASRDMDGHIDELRISKGIARWTSNFTPPTEAYSPEDLSDWGRKCAVTIDNTKVSGSANHTDIPILITEDNLPSEIFDADGSYPANADGGDIRFTSDIGGTTELSREIVEFTIDNDPANGTAQIWVKIPTLDYNDDTVIYIWYNNSSAIEPASDGTYGSESTWGSNYKGVWHLEGLNDSTSNANTLTNPNSAPFVAGQIDNGVDLEEGLSHQLSIVDNASLSITGDMTIGGWVNVETALTSGQLKVIVAKYGSVAADQNYYLVYYHDGANPTLRVYFGGSVAVTVFKQEQTLSTATWYYVKAVIDVSAASVEFFVDGSSIAGDMVQNGATAIGDGSTPFRIGARDSGSYWDGKQDEIRISDTKRTGDWIATEYNNQGTPSTFASAGTPQDTGEVTFSVSDTTAIIDNIIINLTKNFSVSDTTSISDNIILGALKEFVVSSTTTITDSITTNGIYNFLVNSIISITDSIITKLPWTLEEKPSDSTWTEEPKINSNYTNESK